MEPPHLQRQLRKQRDSRAISQSEDGNKTRLMLSVQVSHLGMLVLVLFTMAWHSCQRSRPPLLSSRRWKLRRLHSRLSRGIHRIIAPSFDRSSKISRMPRIENLGLAF